MQLPDVLVFTNTRTRKVEFRVYADATGATVHITADPASSVELWKSAPLIVVVEDMATTVTASNLPTTERCGQAVLLTSDNDLNTAAETGRAVGASYICHHPVGVAWLLSQMMHAAYRGADARQLIADAQTTGN
ncbi:hypothetical protein AB0B10_25435 [Micromonospora arborensis]|uniref:hypothetical protein n=1 Tax=Micromonospora arborensis TaxID=2116518 RepID=UPI0033DBEFBF